MQRYNPTRTVEAAKIASVDFDAEKVVTQDGDEISVDKRWLKQFSGGMDAPGYYVVPSGGDPVWMSGPEFEMEYAPAGEGEE